jgi:hypothetical protein
MKSSAGKIFGGFTTMKWTSNKGNFEDAESFIFSLDLKKIWICDSQKFEITHSPDVGPIFGGNSLSLRESPFNQTKGGKCYVGISDQAGYPVETDEKGNSVLTGEGAAIVGSHKRFTLTHIEIYELAF